MNNLFILISMFFMHIVDDYYLQGVLAKLKQKASWPADVSLYAHDYMAALVAHGMSWAFCVMLPISASQNFNVKPTFFLFWVVMGLLHACIDDQKANQHTINLIQDQLLHVLQIVIIFTAYITNVI